jgi:transglutaminase-like putative cysteine protease
MNTAQRDGLPIRLSRIFLLAFIISAFVLASFLSQFTNIAPEDKEAGSRVFTIVVSVTYENRNTKGTVWNFTKDDRALGLFMNNSWQTVYLTNVSCPVERFETDTDGNPTAFLSFPRSGISSGENFSYEAAYTVVLKPRSIPEISENDSGTLYDMPENLKSSYCGSVGPWQVNDSTLRDLAYGIAGNETRVLSIVKKFIVWIDENIVYGTLDVPRYPKETLLGEIGDCDDQANLLITLCRIVGIPAYLQVGCVYMPGKSSEDSYWEGHWVSKLTSIGWHGWAMVYVPPWGWVPVDLTYIIGDLSVHPLNAINGSAIIAYPTVQYANVTSIDYVADWYLNPRDFLIAHDFYIYAHDIMTEETVQEGKAGTIPVFPIQLVSVIPVFSRTPLVRRSTGRKNSQIFQDYL